MAKRRTLTQEQADALRASTEPYRALSAKYGVSLATIAQIKAGTIYNDPPPDQITRGLVEEIANSTETQKALAERFGMPAVYISIIARVYKALKD